MRIWWIWHLGSPGNPFPNVILNFAIFHILDWSSSSHGYDNWLSGNFVLPKAGIEDFLVSIDFRIFQISKSMAYVAQIGTYIHLLPLGWLLLPPQNHHFSSNSPSQSMDSDHPHRIPQVRFSFNFSPLFCLGTWLIHVSASSTLHVCGSNQHVFIGSMGVS